MKLSFEEGGGAVGMLGEGEEEGSEVSSIMVAGCEEVEEWMDEDGFEPVGWCSTPKTISRNWMSDDCAFDPPPH